MWNLRSMYFLGCEGVCVHFWEGAAIGKSVFETFSLQNHLFLWVQFFWCIFLQKQPWFCFIIQHYITIIIMITTIMIMIMISIRLKQNHRLPSVGWTRRTNQSLTDKLSTISTRCHLQHILGTFWKEGKSAGVKYRVCQPHNDNSSLSWCSRWFTTKFLAPTLASLRTPMECLRRFASFSQ